MIAGLASLIFIPLLAASFAHVLWAFGSTWPVKDEAALARTVIGRKGITAMPPRLLTALIAILIFAVGIWALAMTESSPNLLLTLGGVALAVVFAVRGIVGHTDFWRSRLSEEPFAAMDKKVYSPIILLIGIGFALLVVWRLTAI